MKELGTMQQAVKRKLPITAQPSPAPPVLTQAKLVPPIRLPSAIILTVLSFQLLPTSVLVNLGARIFLFWFVNVVKGARDGEVCRTSHWRLDAVAVAWRLPTSQVGCPPNRSGSIGKRCAQGSRRTSCFAAAAIRGSGKARALDCRGVTWAQSPGVLALPGCRFHVAQSDSQWLA